MPDTGQDYKDYISIFPETQTMEAHCKRHRNVKYFIISNEPGKDQGYLDVSKLNPGIDDEDIMRIRDYIKEFSVAMKIVDPEIRIIAPEMEGRPDALMNKLFASPNFSDTPDAIFSIKGQIGANFYGPSTITNTLVSSAYFVDYISAHLYAGFGFIGSDVRTGFVNFSYPRPSPSDDEQLPDFLINTHKLIIGASTNGGGFDRSSNLKIIVDEFNTADLNGDAGISSSSITSITQESINANTFLAGPLCKTYARITNT
jgi:hypothetical protein